MFEQYEVYALSVSDFLDRYYKPDRYKGRGEEYAKCLLASHEANYERDGYDIISHHDSVTGNVVAYFGKSPPNFTRKSYPVRLRMGHRKKESEK